ncbi:hypothetical protein ABK040_000540 [Willaertia magna]
MLLNQNLNTNILFNKYITFIKEINDLDFKILQLKRLQNKITDESYLGLYFSELLNLLIESNNNNLLKEVFIEYCKLKDLNYELIDKILNSLNKNRLFNSLTKDTIIFEYLIILNNSVYNKNNILNKLLEININWFNRQEYISLFKKVFNKVNLKNISLNKIISIVNLIKDYNDLLEETILLYKELYNVTNNIKYLEITFNLNTKDKEIENKLLNEYLKLNLIDKYFNLYIKINENKLDSTNILMLKYFQNQNKTVENIINDNNNLKQIITNQEKKIVEQNKEIIKLNQTVNDLSNFIGSLLKNCNLENELTEWKSNNEFVKIIKITTPLNVSKEENDMWEKKYNDDANELEYNDDESEDSDDWPLTPQRKQY